MTTRAIADTFRELYGAEVSPSLISKVNEAVCESVKTWQTRPLDDLYPIVYWDGIVVKIRQENREGAFRLYAVL